MDFVIEPISADLIALREEYAATAYQRAYDAVKLTRQLEYAQKSDPIFFKYQRGESTEQEWLDAIAAVDAANPYPDEPENG